MNTTFELPGSYKKWTWGLIIVGLVALLYGLIMLHPFEHGHGEEHIGSTRFWAVLLQNSVYWLLTVNAAMFLICATTMAMGGWQVALRRVPEAISSVLPVLGSITFIILMILVWGGHSDIYHWVDKTVAASDPVIKGKSGFLNPVFFTVMAVITIGGWALLGRKMRAMSLKIDENGPLTYEQGKRWIWSNTVWASIFMVFFTLTVASSTPWLWLMSIDPHWYSTMYSWYNFASTFVSGLCLITIYVIFLKNRGQLEYVTEEHLQDLGKFIFAFSIFWTYIWFSQYLLIWYSNQPEETKYFIERIGTATHAGPYKGLFFLNLIINFVAPILILMKKSTKRNWSLMVFMSVLLLFGHWIDYYLMVMPGTVGKHAELMPFEFGIAALFIGIIMWSVGRFLTKHPLTPKNHPFLKESVIHQS